MTAGDRQCRLGTVLIVEGDGAGLRIDVRDGDGTVSQASDEIIPASLWNRDLVSQTVLLNTLTGKQMAIKVADLGADPVRVHGSTVPAHHYKVTGELERELWYDQSDRLVLVKFTAKDNSEISYVLE